MPLSAGDKLGPYEILAPIGAGGMGEVWKARDTRLDRDRRHQAAQRAAHRAIRAGSPRHRGAEPSAHLPDLRRRPGLSGAGVCRGPPIQGPCRGRRRARGSANRRRARSCARQGHSPSRSEARQHSDDRDGSQAARFRPGQAGLGRREATITIGVSARRSTCRRNKPRGNRSMRARMCSASARCCMNFWRDAARSIVSPPCCATSPRR